MLRYLPAPEIASELFVSVNTIRTHTRHIYAKLDAHSRLEAVARARALGLLAGSARARLNEVTPETLARDDTETLARDDTSNVCSGSPRLVLCARCSTGRPSLGQTSEQEVGLPYGYSSSRHPRGDRIVSTAQLAGTSGVVSRRGESPHARQVLGVPRKRLARLGTSAAHRPDRRLRAKGRSVLGRGDRHAASTLPVLRLGLHK